MRRIAFHKDCMHPILIDQKTVTRRRWDPEYAESIKVGEELLACVGTVRNGEGKPFAIIEVKDVMRECRFMAYARRRPGGDEVEAKKEGCESAAEFRALWRQMHGPRALAEPCYRITFKVVRLLAF